MTDAPRNALARYLDEMKLSDRQFAEMLVAAGHKKIGRSYITQLRLGLRTDPSMALARKIAAVTEGHVPFESWAEVSEAADTSEDAPDEPPSTEPVTSEAQDAA